MDLRFNTLIDLLRHRAEADRDRIAYIYLRDGQNEDTRWTYGEFEGRVIQLARAILNHAEPGDRALICHHPGMEYILSFWACMYAGVVAVPVYPPRFNQKLERIQTIVSDVGARIALTSTSVLETVRPLFAEFQSLAKIEWIETEKLMSQVEAPVPSGRPLVSREYSDLAFIQYTSGSTSNPKGVMLTHGNLISNLDVIQAGFGHHEKSFGITWLPPYHDMGLIGGILSPAYAGFPVAMLSPYSFLQRPARWLQAITKYQATSSGAPNFAYEICVKRVTDEQLAELDLSHWETAFCGAEPIRAEVLDAFAKKFAVCGFRKEAFYPCYGLAEGTLMVSGGTRMGGAHTMNVDAYAMEHDHRAVTAPAKDGSQMRTLVSCGSQPAHHEIRIVDTDQDRFESVPDGIIGEIWVHGPSVAKGYWNKADESETTFHATLKTNPGADAGKSFLRTGDLGFLKDGQLFVTGRAKDLVIIRGRNVYPQDVEATVQSAHPGVETGNGAVFSVDHQGEERLVVVQEIDRRFRSGVDAGAILSSIRDRILESHELKAHAIMLVKQNSIPLTSSGKIQRQATRRLFMDGGLEEISRYQEGTT